MADIPVNASDGQVTVDVVTNGQVIFAYDFRADKVDDLKAIYRTVAGAETNLVGGVNFTATGLGTATGGTITFTTFPGTVAGSKVTIYRDIEIERLSDYQQDLFADDLNLEQDTIFMILQEVARDIGRALKSALGIAPPAAGHVLLSDGAGGVTEGPTGDDIDNAQGYAGAAAASASAAATSAGNSASSATLASQWAQNPEDTAVPGTGGAGFSSFHWMRKSLAIYNALANTLAGWIHAATAKTPMIDADEFGYWDSVSGALRKLTLANLADSIFIPARTIANATFAGASFRLRNAATAFYLNWNVTNLTASRTVTWGDRDMVVNPSDEFVQSITVASAVAAIDIPNLANFNQVEIEGTIIGAAATTLLAQVSTNNGTSFIGTATYQYEVVVGNVSAAGANQTSGQGAMNITGGQNISGSPNVPTPFKITFYSFNEGLEMCAFSQFGMASSGLVLFSVHREPGLVARNAVRLLLGSGNIAKASIRVKGRR